MARFKFVSELMGVILLVVNFISLIVWYYNEMVEGALIWLFAFLLTVGLVLLCERIIAISEIDSFLHVRPSDKGAKQLKRLFFIIPCVFIVVAVSILVVATFKNELRAYFWLMFLFNTSGILLVYCGSFLDMLQEVFLADEEYEQSQKENRENMSAEEENIEWCEVENNEYPEEN